MHRHKPVQSSRGGCDKVTTLLEKTQTQSHNLQKCEGQRGRGLGTSDFAQKCFERKILWFYFCQEIIKRNTVCLQLEGRVRDNIIYLEINKHHIWSRQLLFIKILC